MFQTRLLRKQIHNWLENHAQNSSQCFGVRRKGDIEWGVQEGMLTSI